MLIAVSVFVALGIGVYLFLQNKTFGQLPTGKRLERVQKSIHYKEGKFQNLNKTPDLTEGVGYVEVMRDFLFNKSKRVNPIDPIPSQKTDLKQLDLSKDILVWFGHSSYFIQIDGMRFLIDPVFSGNASPVPGTVKSFPGSDVYSVDDLPKIDVLFISHDHWDHLDYETVMKLKSKVGKIITGLGTGEHFESWGFPSDQVIEKEWNEVTELGNGFSVINTPARHFSGRGFVRQPTMWTSFVLQTPTMKLFLGGDSGYDSHFAAIGEKYGPFDLALLECGQYNKNWRYIHSMPDEVVKEAIELKTKRLIPVHWGKFALAQHDWDEPIIQVSEQSKKVGLPLVTPMIGEVVYLKDTTQVFSAWWEKIK